MKKWIHSSTEVGTSYDRYRDPARSAIQKASRLAKKILKEHGYFAVCYAVQSEVNDTIEYSTDGNLFAAYTYEEYRDQVKAYCDGKPERQFKFETVFDTDAQYDYFSDAVDWSQYNDKQAAVILQGLNDELDISWYADPVFSAGQMQAIYNGLRLGLDVSYYADPAKSTAVMNKYFESMKNKAMHNGRI